MLQRYLKLRAVYHWIFSLDRKQDWGIKNEKSDLYIVVILILRKSPGELSLCLLSIFIRHTVCHILYVTKTSTKCIIAIKVITYLSNILVRKSIPALRISISIWSTVLRRVSQALFTESNDFKSINIPSTSGLISFSFVNAASIRSLFLQRIMTRAPRSRTSLAVSKPIPQFAPVITTIFSSQRWLRAYWVVQKCKKLILIFGHFDAQTIPLSNISTKKPIVSFPL